MKSPVLVAILCFASCRSHSGASRAPTPVGPAVQLAERFLAADTIGDLETFDSLYFPMEGMSYCAFGFDAYSITTSAAVSDTLVRGDTVFVMVTYQVLGTAHSEDAHRVGPHVWRFTERREAKVETFQAVADSTGRWGFVCDRYRVAPNHMSLSRWLPLVPLLDSASLAEWKTAH